MHIDDRSFFYLAPTVLASVNVQRFGAFYFGGFNMREIWKPIKNYEGSYEVSNKGRIKSYKRNQSIIMKQQKNYKGYFMVCLSNPNFGVYKHTFTVHRLVGFNFLKNKNKKPQINHKNGIKTDNKTSNLEWVTPSENTIHSYKNNLQPCRNGENNYLTKFKNKDVLKIRYLRDIKKLKLKTIAKMFNAKISCISNITNRTTWDHLA